MRDCGFTHEQLKSWLDYDPETGVLTWIGRPPHSSRVVIGSQAGAIKRTRSGVYMHTQILGYRTGNHRIAWFWMTGKWPNKQIDHKDGDGLNNAWDNLREATKEQNMSNRRQPRTSKNLKGTSRSKSGKWKSQINHNGKTIHIGTYTTEEEAHKAYCEAAVKLHGEFASFE
jgi:hypothetical protein